MTPIKLLQTTRSATLILVAFGLSGFVLVESSQANCPCNQKMEAKLKGAYTYYTDAYTVLDFKFQVNKKENHVDVTLVGQNFGAWDAEWTGKDNQAFLGYLGIIGQTVSTQMEKPIVRFRVIDLQNKELGKYQYGK
jgi:hypothetical protein